MYLNGEGIEVLHLPAAHTDGDSVVFFRRSDVVAAGDVLDLTRFPVHRPRARRRHPGRDRRAQPARRARDSVRAARLAGRRHATSCRATAALRSARRRRVPRHGDDRPRSRCGPDQEGQTLDQVKARIRRRGTTPGSDASAAFVEATYTSLRRAGLSGPRAPMIRVRDPKSVALLGVLVLGAVASAPAWRSAPTTARKPLRRSI